MTYTVVLLDNDGFEITSSLEDGLSNAKKIADYLLSIRYEKAVETTHEAMMTAKAEVRNASGVCVWDRSI